MNRKGSSTNILKVKILSNMFFFFKMNLSILTPSDVTFKCNRLIQHVQTLRVVQNRGELLLYNKKN